MISVLELKNKRFDELNIQMDEMFENTPKWWWSIKRQREWMGELEKLNRKIEKIYLTLMILYN